MANDRRPPSDPDRKGLRRSRHDQCGDEGPCARRGGRGARSARPRQGAGGRKTTRRDRAEFVEGQPVAQEGGAPEFPPQRQCAHRRRTWPGDLVGQGSSKLEGWGENRFKDAGFRAVPGAIVRRSAFIARDVVLMPSFVNLGAYVDEKTMVDTWVTVGSCAQIGKNVHLSGGAGIGGVIEPLQANPTIIEDNCFIGARSEVVEGVIVSEGSVLSMGVFISASTKVIDRASGKVHVGHVPPYSVVVPGALPGKPLPDGSPGPSLYCAVIVKTVDAQTRAKTGINELLRE